MSAHPVSVEGKTVIITGAGQGIGRVLALAFAAGGAHVAVADVNADAADQVAAEISTSGGKALSVAVDVADPESTQAMAASVQNHTGRIDALINNAALFSTLKMQPFEDIPLDVWEQVMRVNVTGPFLCAKAVAPAMRKGGGGRITNVSSGAVSMGRPNYLHYTTSKAAVIGMTRSMARELGSDGITVNAVLPGSVETEIPRETVTAEAKKQIVAMQCIPRRQVPEDLIGVMLFLASDASAFITGQSITVDGGATHL